MSENKVQSCRDYNPEEAKSILRPLSTNLQFFDYCWGSTMNQRARGHGSHGSCDCKSKQHSFDEAAKFGTTSEHTKQIVDLVSGHFNVHAAFLPPSGSHPQTARDVYLKCIREAYEWCYSRNLPRVWAYLFSNWYRPNRWTLWARSASEEIPVLKTSMIVESHWRLIKHDYLHR